MNERGARGGFDLHTHSTRSDGTTSPTEIAAEAASIGLEGFALTDHDTTSGWDEAREAAATAGVDFVPGIEITTTHRGRSRHLLGYGFRAEDPELDSALDAVRESRIERAREMVRRVARDFAITWEDVVGDEDERTIGRPHIADALVAAGYVTDRSAAFEQVLFPGSKYYLGTYAIETEEAIRLVRGAGGAAVLAHPAAQRQRAAATAQELRELAAAGLAGVELDHPEHREDWLPPLRAVTAELGLLSTGSSDYHGAGKPNRLGACRTPAETVARLRQNLAQPN